MQSVRLTAAVTKLHQVVQKDLEPRPEGSLEVLSTGNFQSAYPRSAGESLVHELSLPRHVVQLEGNLDFLRGLQGQPENNRRWRTTSID
mmetsp:Transcript_122001/g.211701  ORF Transcript_122001/g.211701 Transcript_122001/m.211701 type:complete len:89 (+) Transcript_122001:347-613(+)